MALRSNCAALTRPTLSNAQKAHQTLVPRMTMPTTINPTPSQWRRANRLMPDAPAREGNPDEIQTQHRIGVMLTGNRLQDAQPQRHAAAQT